jgi:hypothetical protein
MIDKSLNWMKNPSENLPEAEGYYVGIANLNKPVFIEPWSKYNWYVENSNIVQMGVSGAGMCFSTKIKVVKKRGINYGKKT